jgi:hypothetical protein
LLAIAYIQKLWFSVCRAPRVKIIAVLTIMTAPKQAAENNSPEQNTARGSTRIERGIYRSTIRRTKAFGLI